VTGTKSPKVYSEKDKNCQSEDNSIFSDQEISHFNKNSESRTKFSSMNLMEIETDSVSGEEREFSVVDSVASEGKRNLVFLI